MEIRPFTLQSGPTDYARRPGGAPERRHGRDTGPVPRANNDMDQPLLGLHQLLARAGLVTVRFNFPYAEAGRKWPDQDEVLEGIFRLVLEYVAQMEEFKGLALYLGGKSMGARLAAQIVAKDVGASGLAGLPGLPAPLPGKTLNTAVNPCISCPARPCSSRAPGTLFAGWTCWEKCWARCRSGATSTSSPAWAIPLSQGGTA